MRGFWIGIGIGLVGGVLLMLALGPQVRPSSAPSPRVPESRRDGGLPPVMPDDESGGQPSPGPECPAPFSTEHPSRSWPSHALAAELARLVALPPDARDEAANKRLVWVAQSIRRSTEAEVSDADVLALLDDPVVERRQAGAWAATRASPGVLDRLLEVAASDPSLDVRVPAIVALHERDWKDGRVVELLVRLSSDPETGGYGFYGMTRLAGRHTSVRERLLRAASSSDPNERAQALRHGGRYISGDLELSSAVLRGLEDESLVVREEAVKALKRLGERGSGPALELLLSGDYPDSSSPYDFAHLVVASGRLIEALDRGPPATAVRALLGALDVDDYRATALRLRGRFDRLLDAWQGDGDDYGPMVVYELAVLAGEPEVLFRAAGDRARPWSHRLGALAVVGSGTRHPVLYPGMLRAVMAEGAAKPHERRQALEAARSPLHDHPRSEEIRQIIREVSENDPSPWVRLEAQRLLEN